MKQQNLDRGDSQPIWSLAILTCISINIFCNTQYQWLSKTDNNNTFILSNIILAERYQWRHSMIPNETHVK